MSILTYSQVLSNESRVICDNKCDRNYNWVDRCLYEIMCVV